MDGLCNHLSTIIKGRGCNQPKEPFFKALRPSVVASVPLINYTERPILSGTTKGDGRLPRSERPERATSITPAAPASPHPSSDWITRPTWGAAIGQIPRAAKESSEKSWRNMLDELRCVPSARSVNGLFELGKGNPCCRLSTHTTGSRKEVEKRPRAGKERGNSCRPRPQSDLDVQATVRGVNRRSRQDKKPKK